MDMDLYDLFGLEAPQEEGAGGNEPEVAEPEDEAEEIDGGNEPELAEPAQDDPEPGAQTPQRRRENAARRRRAEQQAAIDKALKAEREANAAAWDAHIKGMGLTDPYNGGKAIETRAQYDAYIARRDAEAVKRGLETGKMTPALFEKAIDQHPTVQAAKQLLDRQAPQDLPAQDDLHAQLDRQIAELQAFDPTVESLDALVGSAKGQEFLDNVAATGNLVKAYKLTYYDELQARTQKAEQTRAAGSGTQHLQHATARGSGAVELTQEIIDSYRMIDPAASVEDIRKYEEKYRSARKKGR